MTTMQVPLLDLTGQYRGIADAMQEAVKTVIEEQRFILGPVVDRFEAEVERAIRSLVG